MVRVHGQTHTRKPAYRVTIHNDCADEHKHIFEYADTSTTQYLCVFVVNFHELK